jgi:hypothetical protein
MILVTGATGKNGRKKLPDPMQPCTIETQSATLGAGSGWFYRQEWPA